MVAFTYSIFKNYNEEHILQYDMGHLILKRHQINRSGELKFVL